MRYTNNSMLNRRQLMTKVGELIFDGELVNKINRLPIEIHPKEKNSVRCCVHKDRAVTKYKLMAILGYNIEDEEDELTPLSEYAQNSIIHEDKTDNPFTIVDLACSSCSKIKYIVTDQCKGCEGRPCLLNCNKSAITIINGKAHISQDDCVNCGLCMKVCPFHAIIHIPVPCEEACPVDAISKDEDGIERIDEEKCIHCGKCMVACPFGAIMEKSEMVKILNKIRNTNQHMTALIAPALMGQFRTTYSNIVDGLKKLGFDEVVEVAQGADVTIQHEAEELKEKMEAGEDFMTTSCCPAYVELTEKHLTGLNKKVSHTKSPMFYTDRDVKKEYPNTNTVFISPCVSKRVEAKQKSDVDFVMTFEELGTLFIAKEIDVLDVCETEIEPISSSSARGFAASGGVTEAVKTKANGELEIKEVVINGINKDTMKELKKMNKGKCTGNFVEVMSCENGCIGGPCAISNPKVAQRFLKKYIE